MAIILLFLRILQMRNFVGVISHLKDPIIYNSSFNVARKKVKITKSSHVPVLVPVRILELPNLGSLDIDLVRESVYFFS